MVFFYMLRFLSSGLLTFFLILINIGYLVQFRLFGIITSPEGMIYLSIVLILQCILALCYRILLLSGKVQEQYKPSKRWEDQKIKGTAEEAYRFLEGGGFAKSEYREEADTTVALFSKRLKGSRIIETAIYGALVFTLLAGLLNHAFGIRGYVEFGATGGWTDLEKADLKRGILARIMPTKIKIRLTEKKSAGPDMPSSIVFEASEGDDGENTERYWLKPGDSARFGMLRIQYMGDYYLAFPTVYRKRHDYRAVAQKLKLTDEAQGIYSGDLRLREFETKGTIEYEPAEKRFRIRIYRDEELEAETVFIHPDEGKDGDFTIRVPSLGHLSVLRISRYNYRMQVLAGMAVCVLFFLTRMIFIRPLRVWLSSEKGKPRFYANQRRVKKALLRL
jgi:hypothetical protein